MDEIIYIVEDDEGIRELYEGAFEGVFALKMFEMGETSINKVSTNVGFTDSLYFSKIFKKQQLISPSEHIKKLQKLKDKDS